jgi:hypothetical protein
MTEIAKPGDTLNEPESGTIACRVRRPGGFMTIVAGIFCRIVRHPAIQEITVAICAIGLLPARAPGFHFARPAQWQCKKYKETDDELLNHMQRVKTFGLIGYMLR